MPFLTYHGETRSVVAIQLDHHTRRSRARDDKRVRSLEAPTPVLRLAPTGQKQRLYCASRSCVPQDQGTRIFNREEREGRGANQEVVLEWIDRLRALRALRGKMDWRFGLKTDYVACVLGAAQRRNNPSSWIAAPSFPGLAMTVAGVNSRVTNPSHLS
jgi:hypothetical protein